MAVHIPGVENVEADKQSRQSHSQLEWTLDRTIFRDCLNVVKLVPNIDLFASRLNHQLQPYVSWHPDPGAVAVDAFHLSWKPYMPYMFPPFSLISRVLQKIQRERIQGIIIVLKWPTQTWWPVLMRMLIDNPVLLPNRKKLLFLPSSPGYSLSIFSGAGVDATQIFLEILKHELILCCRFLIFQSLPMPVNVAMATATTKLQRWL